MSLNLARKWRSKHFDQMVGQDIAVSMLKNSLYKDYFFPLYLFSGQRGCGKTTAARLFAGAVNCFSLPLFQQRPKEVLLPCGTCESCQAMARGNHPDFIEIDAASNTGVDNVRTVIESATLLPTLGRKRIYLVDEAHMLSKAAFNAFLKILEEPPLTAFFIFATTDIHKIIDTVRSRSFQLFFRPIHNELLVSHLAAICVAEGIGYEEEALRLVAQYAEGSARDALNILEQIRFMQDTVSVQAVQVLLGTLSQEMAVALLQAALHQDEQKVQLLLQESSLGRYDALRVWTLLSTLLRDALIYQAQAKTAYSVEYQKMLSALADSVSFESLVRAFDNIAACEPLIMRSRLGFHSIELALYKIAATKRYSTSLVVSENTDNKGRVSVPKSGGEARSGSLNTVNAGGAEPEKIKPVITQGGAAKPVVPQWQTFLDALSTFPDPMLYSIFKQGSIKDIVWDECRIVLSFAQQSLFFEDMLKSAEHSWRPLLHNAFGQSYRIEYTFDKTVTAPQMADSMNTTRVEAGGFNVQHIKGGERTEAYSSKKKSNYTASSVIAGHSSNIHKAVSGSRAINVQDSSRWPKASMVLSVFPGSITEIKGSTDG